MYTGVEQSPGGRRLTEPNREAVQSMAPSMHGVTDESEVFGTIAEVTFELLEPDLCMVIREKNGNISQVANQSTSEYYLTETPSLDSISRLCGSRNTSCKIDDQTNLEKDMSLPQRQNSPLSSYRSLLFVPLTERELVLVGSFEPDYFTARDLKFVEAISDFATAYLEEVRTPSKPEYNRDYVEQMASVLSHDVTNLLMVMEGNIDILRDEMDASELEELELAQKRLRRLIDDVVDGLRSSKTNLEKEPVSLSSLVIQSWKLVGEEERDLMLGELGSVRADPSKLRQVFENLLRNAIQHTEATGTIWVSRTSDGISVEDSGAGIPQDERDQVFKAGYSTNGDQSGLGLSIVQQIVDAHGWDIDITGSDLGGARFEISGMSFMEEHIDQSG